MTRPHLDAALGAAAPDGLVVDLIAHGHLISLGRGPGLGRVQISQRQADQVGQDQGQANVVGNAHPDPHPAITHMLIGWILLGRKLHRSFKSATAEPEDSAALQTGCSSGTLDTAAMRQPAIHSLCSCAQRAGRHLSVWKPKLSSSAMPVWLRGGQLISLMATARRLHAKGDIQYAQIHLYASELPNVQRPQNTPDVPRIRLVKASAAQLRHQRVVGMSHRAAWRPDTLPWGHRGSDDGVARHHDQEQQHHSTCAVRTLPLSYLPLAWRQWLTHGEALAHKS